MSRLLPAKTARAVWGLCFFLSLSACGYTVASKGPSVVPAKARRIAIAEVENPTFFTWMEPRLRSLIRDEFSRRGWTVWVDRNQAESLLYVTVSSYTRGDTITGAQQQTLRYKANIVFNARLVSAADNSPIWQSGDISVTRSFSTGEEAEVDAMITDLAVRQLADRLSENY